MALHLESSISFLTSIIQAKSHFVAFQLSSVVSSYYLWNSLSNNSMLFNLHFVGTIITLINLGSISAALSCLVYPPSFPEQRLVIEPIINLNNFRYPTKIRLCLQPNQNHLLRDLFFRSRHAEINGNRQLVDRRYQLCQFSQRRNVNVP